METRRDGSPEDAILERFAAAQDALLRKGRPPAALEPALRFAGRLCDVTRLAAAGWVHLTGLEDGRLPALWRGDVWLGLGLEEDGRRFFARLALSPPLREDAAGAPVPLAPGDETRRAYEGADPFLARVRWFSLSERAVAPARVETPPRDLPAAVLRRVCDDLGAACRPGGPALLRALAAAADGRTYVGSRDLSPAEKDLELLADAVAERLGAGGAGLSGARTAVAEVAAPLWERLDPDGAVLLAGVRDPDVFSRFLVLALNAGVRDALPALLCAQLRDPARPPRMSPLDWDVAATAARAAGLHALEAACLRRAVRAGACADAFHPRLLAACRAHFASLPRDGAPGPDDADALALLDSLRADCAGSPAWLVLRGLAGLAAAEPADAPAAADAATAALPPELGEALSLAVARHRAEHCLARDEEVVPSLAAPVEWQAALAGAHAHPRLVRRALAALPAPLLSLGFPGEDSPPRSFARGPAPEALWRGVFPETPAPALASRLASLAAAASRPFDRPHRLAPEERTDSAPLDWLAAVSAPASGVGLLSVRGAAGKTPPDPADAAPLRALPLPGAGAPLEASLWAFRVWEKNAAADAKLFVRDCGPLWAVWPGWALDRDAHRRGERLALRLALLAVAVADAPDAAAEPGLEPPADAAQPSFRAVRGTVASVRTGLEGPGGAPVRALELDAGPALPFRPVVLAGETLAAAARPGAAVRVEGWFVARPDLDAPVPGQVPWREDEPAARAARGGPAFVRTEFSDEERAALGPDFEPRGVDFARAALDELRHRPAVLSAAPVPPNPEGVDLVVDAGGGAPRLFAVEALAEGEPPRRRLAPGVERLVVRTAPAPGGLALSYAEFPL